MPPANDDRVEHLKMIQAVIARMAQNSFTLKGWSVLLVSALLGLAAADTNIWFVLVAYIPVLSFWYLDAYFLHLERLYRALFDDVRRSTENVEFSMNVDGVSHVRTDIGSAALSRTLLLFYGSLLGAIAAVTIASAIQA